MKKQKIRPAAIIRFIWLSIWIFFILLGAGASAYVIVEAQYTVLHCLGLIGGILCLLICSIFLILDLKRGVEFNSQSIKVIADPADKKGYFVRRFQHGTEINYNEIEDIILVASNTDSYGKTLEHSFIQMPYIDFICKGNKQKAINVFFYSKKQTMKIIDEVKRRALEAGNELEIESGEEMLKNFLQKK